MAKKSAAILRKVDLDSEEFEDEILVARDENGVPSISGDMEYIVERVSEDISVGDSFAVAVYQLVGVKTVVVETPRYKVVD